jgi:hypothetical protein
LQAPNQCIIASNANTAPSDRVLLYQAACIGEIMIELLTETALVEGVLEEVGNQTERYTNRWWWKPLRYFVLISPFIGCGIYYFWFL